jgi:uncharacterized protein YcbX
MAGEDLACAEVVPRGLEGDRRFALIDRETGRVVSAKRPRRYPGLLGYRARYDGGPDGAVSVTCLDGTELSTARAGEAEAFLSTRLGREVALVETPPDGARLEYHWPDQAGLWYQGRLHRDEITEHVIMPGTFFDSGIIHLLTTSSLTRIAELAPGSRFEPGRFRPNVVVATEGAGFVENDWVGKVIRIGESVRLRIVKMCFRCVMVNLAQPGFDADGGVLAAAYEHNKGDLGVKGDVLSSGSIAVGDPVVVE